MQPIIFLPICRSFLVKLGNSIWLWGYWWKLGVVLAQLHWTLSWWPSWKEIHFASHTFAVQSPTRHLVQQMGSVYTWNSDASTISTFSTSARIYLYFTSYRAFFHTGNMYWVSNMWNNVVVKKLNTDRNPDLCKYYSNLRWMLCPALHLNPLWCFLYQAYFWSGNSVTISYYFQLHFMSNYFMCFFFSFLIV